MSYTYLYLLINVGTLLFPFLFSFERRVKYYTWWPFLLPAMVITGTIFLTWDYFFTLWGVWGFSERYTTGLKILNLPVEEIMFFITVPYASIFIYAFVNRFWPGAGIFDLFHRHISYGILAIAMALLLIHPDRAYTALNAGYAAGLLSLQLFVVKGNYMGKFYRFYLWHLIPFFIVNGLLTGSGITQEVVWYNNNENLGIRMGTIPVEDSLYSMSLMLMNIMFFEYFSSRFGKKNIQSIAA